MKCVICDRCGRVIQKDEKIGYIGVSWREKADGDLMQPNPYEDCDICEACMRKIVAVIDNMAARKSVIRGTPGAGRRGKGRESAERSRTGGEPDPAEEEKEEETVGRLADTPKPSHGVNLRELRELVKAGKKPKEIADHFGISLASYYNARKRAEAMWNAGML